MRLLFDHGTLVLAEAPDTNLEFVPGVTWDPRVALWRAPAWRYADVLGALKGRRLQLTDEVMKAGIPDTGPWTPIDLRPYQHAALLAWELGGKRGTLVLPTGSGKTRIALAALAQARAPALCIVPTRALLEQWVKEIGRVYGKPVGCLGDGRRQLEAVTVATFESAWRMMPRIGQRFELLVVDEVHHFGVGMRDEALEMCAATQRLGLTATPPDGLAAERIEELVGPTAYQLAVGDLAGTYLAGLDIVVMRLGLEPEERRAYDAEQRVFKLAFRVFMRLHPHGTWEEFRSAAVQSAEGRAALAAWRKSRQLLDYTRGKATAVRSLLARHRDSRVLVFTASNETAYRISRDELIMPITCDISRAERQWALEAFRRGELGALVSARVLNEGIDVPDADVAIMVGATHGEREYVQRVGRLLRPRPGKRATVYELVTLATSEARIATKRRRGLAATNAVSA